MPQQRRRKKSISSPGSEKNPEMSLARTLHFRGAPPKKDGTIWAHRPTKRRQSRTQELTTAVRYELRDHGYSMNGLLFHLSIARAFVMPLLEARNYTADDCAATIAIFRCPTSERKVPKKTPPMVHSGSGEEAGRQADLADRAPMRSIMYLFWPLHT